MQILVLDNSPVALDSRFIPENCTYFNTDEPFAIRSARAVELVSTPYTIIGADDELYLPSSLQKMQNFLDLNLDYVAVGGHTMAVWEYGPKIAATWAYAKTHRYHNDEADPLKRIAKHTGNGVSPLTSFFTCNLTRTWAAQDCLSMYAKAPVLATDAISVLTICGAGKSKYLDLIYWVRNWNQSPKSHAGWNRKVFLHEWWKDSRNRLAADRFAADLERVYQKYSESPTFSLAWDLILDSDKSLQKRERSLKILFRSFNEKRLFKSVKFRAKSIFHPKGLPATVDGVVQRMSDKGIFIPQEELRSATRIVATLLPYKSW